jgi:hypothetical protein
MDRKGKGGQAYRYSRFLPSRARSAVNLSAQAQTYEILRTLSGADMASSGRQETR